MKLSDFADPKKRRRLRRASERKKYGRVLTEDERLEKVHEEEQRIADIHVAMAIAPRLKAVEGMQNANRERRENAERRRMIWQRLAKDTRRRNPNLSKKRVAELIAEKPEAEGASVETIRKQIATV